MADATPRRRARATIVGFLAALVAVGGIVLPHAGAAPLWTTVRVAGADRYATAAALSRRAFPGTSDQAVVASGETFADALAAAPAAARRHAPLLLVQQRRVPQASLDELQRLHPTRIVLAGGPAAVSDVTQAVLAGIAPVTRVGGVDRFETATRLAESSFGTGVPVLFLAQGRTFPDALAAGAVAGRVGGPVLLVERTSIPAVVLDAIERLRPARIIVVGGRDAVGDEIAFALRPYDAIRRVAGADRYATAAALAAEVPDPSTVGLVASGADFPDALAAGASAAALGGTLGLTTTRCLPTASAQGFADDGVHQLLVVGGEAAVPTQAVTPCAPVFAPTTSTSSTSTSSTSTTSTSSTTSSTSSTTTSTSSTTTTTTTTAPTPTSTTSSTTSTTTTTSTTSTTSTTAPTTTTTSTTVPATTGPAVPTLAVAGALPGDAPDPSVLRVGDRWYAYSTQVVLTKLPVRSSSDLQTWSAATEAMPNLAPWAEFGANWAPSVVDVDGTYVAWYAARDHATGRQCVSRAVATDPAGPFVDDLTAAPLCQLSLGGSIDPNVFTDTDGSRWLYWKSDENALGANHPARLWVAALSADATRVTGTPVSVLTQGSTWEAPTIEQPAMVHRGSTYYLFYSGGWWESEGYGIGYATGSSPTGPFTKRTGSAPWFGSATGAKGPGALDVFAGPDGLWATWHAWPGQVGYALGGVRTTRLGRLSF